MLFFDAVWSGTDLRLMIATNNATALVLLTDNDPEEVFSRVNVNCISYSRQILIDVLDFLPYT